MSGYSSPKWDPAKAGPSQVQAQASVIPEKGCPLMARFPQTTAYTQAVFEKG